MKRLFCVIALLGLLLSGCIGPGAQDWEYELPNGYEIWRINSRSIRCLKVSGSTGSETVGRYVSAFCYGEQYVGLQCVDVPADLQAEIDTSDPDYYLLDTLTGTMNGPYTQEAYAEQTKTLEPLGDWIPTRPAPEGAKYE